VSSCQLFPIEPTDSIATVLSVRVSVVDMSVTVNVPLLFHGLPVPEGKERTRTSQMSGHQAATMRHTVSDTATHLAT
tara:strand:- start:508 stop:738 length:231 start_codon:yes stop_codon:yes gene_type:complete